MLWVLLALGGLAASASAVALVERVLVTRYRDYTAALGLAEAGLADALAAWSADPLRAARIDSLADSLETGSYVTRWEPVGARVQVVSLGRSGGAVGTERTIEAWVERPVTGGWRIVAWREPR